MPNTSWYCECGPNDKLSVGARCTVCGYVVPTEKEVRKNRWKNRLFYGCRVGWLLAWVLLLATLASRGLPIEKILEMIWPVISICIIGLGFHACDNHINAGPYGDFKARWKKEDNPYRHYRF